MLTSLLFLLPLILGVSAPRDALSEVCSPFTIAEKRSSRVLGFCPGETKPLVLLGDDDVAAVDLVLESEESSAASSSIAADKRLGLESGVETACPVGDAFPSATSMSGHSMSSLLPDDSASLVIRFTLASSFAPSVALKVFML